MTEANRRFFVVSTYVVKSFYIFAKHFIGFYLNYTRFLGRVGPAEQRVMYGLLLGACWGTTIAMFIHTLKFKRFIGARAGALAYEASFPWMIFFFAKLLAMMAKQADLVAVASVGARIARKSASFSGRGTAVACPFSTISTKCRARKILSLTSCVNMES